MDIDWLGGFFIDLFQLECFEALFPVPNIGLSSIGVK